nr:far upstream element-binding protein 1-like [Lytechinus pictus]
MGVICQRSVYKRISGDGLCPKGGGSLNVHSSHFHVSFFIFQIAAKIGGSSTLGLNSGSSSAEVSGLPPSGGLGAISGGDAASGIKRPLEDSNSEAEPATKNLAMQNENEFNTFGASLPGMPRAAPANTMTHPGEKTEEFFVPNKMVGLIIGRQGQQISALQSESACNIQIAPGEIKNHSILS